MPVSKKKSNGKPITLGEVKVYSKRKYKSELDKQQAKYLADMSKYSKDSTQWVKANEAYNDSLKSYTGAVANWESEIAKQQAYDDAKYKKLLESGFLTNKEKVDTKAHLDKGKARYVNYEDKVNITRNDYNIPPANMLYPTEYGYNTLNISGTNTRNNYPNSIDNYTSSILKNSSKVQPIGLASTSEGGSHGIFKKPTKLAIPLKPTKSTTARNVRYDDTYENLSMHSLWANKAKQDITAKVGTLNPLESTNPSKGFTMKEAIKFPQEIKDKYNIDYIQEQIDMKLANPKGKKKLFLGGAMAVGQLALSGIQAIQANQDAKNAARTARRSALRSEFNSDKSQLNNYNTKGSDVSIFEKGGKKKRKGLKTTNLAKVPNSNVYKVIGPKHEQGGVDIAKDVEVEGGEYIKVDSKGIKVISDDPSFSQIPADNFEAKATTKSPDTAFNEEFAKQELAKGGKAKKKGNYEEGGFANTKFGKGLNAAAPYIDNISNAISTFAKPKVPKPIYNKAIDLDTGVNVNPQLSEVKQNAENIKRGIRGNFASPTAALALESKANNDALTQKNTLLGQQQEQERELGNKETLINTQIDAGNRQLANTYKDRVANRTQSQISELSANAANIQDDIVHKQNMDKMGDFQDKQLLVELSTDVEGKNAPKIMMGAFDTILRQGMDIDNSPYPERTKQALKQRASTLGIQ